MGKLAPDLGLGGEVGQNLAVWLPCIPLPATINACTPPGRPPMKSDVEKNIDARVVAVLRILFAEPTPKRGGISK